MYTEKTVVLARRSDGSLYFWRNEHELRRLDSYLTAEEKEIVNSVWPPEERFYRFSLTYVPDYVTKQDVQEMMAQQEKTFLLGIEMLTNKILPFLRPSSSVTLEETTQRAAIGQSAMEQKIDLTASSEPHDGQQQPPKNISAEFSDALPDNGEATFRGG